MRNKKFFSEIFLQILKSKGYFETFEKKNMTLKAYVFPKLQTAKTWLEKKSKKPCFRTPFDSQHIKGSQTLPKSAGQHFYHIIYHSERD